MEFIANSWLVSKEKKVYNIARNQVGLGRKNARKHIADLHARTKKSTNVKCVTSYFPKIFFSKSDLETQICYCLLPIFFHPSSLNKLNWQKISLSIKQNFSWILVTAATRDFLLESVL